MRKLHLAVACLLLASTGCTCGQGWNCWRPSNMFSRLHDRIHNRSNVGAPCASGACTAPPMMAAPAMAGGDCVGCGSGSQTMSYESYPSAYESEIIGSTYGSSIPSVTAPMSETITPMRAQ